MAIEAQVQATDTLALQKKARRRLVGTIALVVLSLLILPQILKNKSQIEAPSEPVVMMPAQPQLDVEQEEIAHTSEESAHSINESGFDTQAIAEKLADEHGDVNAATDQSKLSQSASKNAALDNEQRVQKQVPAVEVSEDRSTVMASEADAVEAKVRLAKMDEKPAPTSKLPAKQLKTVEKSNTNNAQQGFAVQLGVFANPENVKKMQAKIALAGFESKTSAVAQGTRLRVGYFVSKEGAEEALETLKQNGLTGKIVPR